MGAPKLHQTHQELIRRQENKPEREYQGNARWEPATIVAKTDASNSYWIMCTDGAEQTKVCGRTCTALKIISTPTDGESKSQMKEWRPELVNDQFQSTAVSDGNRNLMVDIYHSAHRSSSGDPEPLLPTLDHPNFSQGKEEDGQHVAPPHTSDVTLENTPAAPNAPVQ